MRTIAGFPTTPATACAQTLHARCTTTTTPQVRRPRLAEFDNSNRSNAHGFSRRNLTVPAPARSEQGRRIRPSAVAQAAHAGAGGTARHAGRLGNAAVRGQGPGARPLLGAGQPARGVLAPDPPRGG